MSSFQFMFLADCQLGAYASFSGLSEQDVVDYAARDMRVWSVPTTDGFEWDAAQLEKAVRRANAIRPDFVVMGGDMIDDAADEAQYEAVMEITSRLDGEIPMKWVPGNHDIAADAVVPTRHSIDKYRELFGPDYYAFDWGSARFVVVDTVVLDHPEHVPTELQEQLAFIEFELVAASTAGRQAVLIGHHPLFIGHADEEDTYWNIPRPRRDALLTLIHRHGARVMFSGHWHRNSHAWDGDFEMVTSGAVGYPLGSDPSGFRLVDVGTDTIHHEYHPLEPGNGTRGRV